MADLASLVLRLSADVAQLQNDLGKANAIAERSARAMQKSFDSVTGGITDSLKNMAGAIAAAFTFDKLIEAGRNAINTADQFEKMSQKVGVSVETLSALSVQAKLSDVDIQSLQGGLSKLAKNAAEAAGGSKQQAAAFQAIGVSVKDAAGNLKPMDTLLAEVSAKFASYRDSAAKTALAQQYFGKSGAELIPLLNQLGSEGFAKAREEAEKYGAVISGDMAKSSERFNDNITKLKIEAQGFATAVTSQLSPGLNKLAESMIAAGETTDRYGGSATMVANAIKVLVAGLVTVKEFLSAVATTTFAFYDAVKTTFEAAGAVVAAFGQAAYESIKGAFSLDPDAIARARTNLTAGLAKIGADVAKSFTGIKDALGGGVTQNIQNVKTTLNDLFGTFSNVSAGADTTAKAMGNLNAPIVANTAAAEAQAKALSHAQEEAAKFLVSISGFGGDKYTKALADYNSKLEQANLIFEKLIASGESYAKAEQFIDEATTQLNQGLEDQVQAMRNANDATAILSTSYARAESDINNQIRLLGMSKEAREADEIATRLTIAALGDLKDFMGPLTEEQQKLIDKNNELAKSFVAQKTAVDNSQEVARQWVSIWSNAGNQIGDAFSKWVVEGGSLMKSLTSIAKQVVEQIIAYFMKLAVINPILNAIFGGSMMAGGGSLLPTMMDAGGGIMSTFFSGASSSGGGSIMSSGGNLMSAGNTMWQGFKNGFTSFFGPSQTAYSQGLMGTYTNPGAFGGPLMGSGTYTPSALGYGVAAAGGIYAGYNEFQNAGGGAAGLIGGAAYGYGTYAASIGVSAALAGGISAGLAAIPVVGWIALAAMLIDKFSGGKLFGTKGKFNFGEQAITIGAGGATVSAGYDLKGQSALFGGSTHSWQSLPVDPAAQKAADDFFNSLTKQTEAFAKQFGATVGDIVGGQFIATFDKHGNVTKTQSTVLGVTYNEDQQHFLERLSAENMIAVLDSLNKGLSAALDQYRGDADELMKITQGLAQAQAMIQKGETFLALGSDQSLTALLKLAEGMQGVGETIDQTLQRILQAQAQYDQFVGQFKPPKNYVDDFEATLAGINDQMNQNIATANALAQAAGAAGASEQDLANIHQYAARQMAAAIQQLEASAQSLAFNLGLTTTGSLDQVNSEIERLQAKQNAGHAVRDFGQAMQDAAQKAKDAMALLLGSLSPYNDQQKLQYALQGLRAGTATKDQVLEIGRRLYASSQAYTDLFNQVQSIPTAAAQGARGAGGGGGGLTGAESTRLQMLLKQQQQLQAAAQLQQYQTLAQQIAEIASAKGEDWQQVVKDMGIDLKAFEKGLGMNDKQLNDYITSIQKQTDSDGNNTKSIVDAINDMSDAIVIALGGTPSHSNNTTTGTGAGGTTPRGHSGHGSRRAISDEDADAIGQSVGRQIRGIALGNVRNQRTRQSINAT